MKSCIKLQDGTKITKKNILGALDQATNGQYSESKRDIILDLVKDEVEKATYYTDLKPIFNPGSPKPENKLLISSVLVNDDIRIAHFLNQLNLKIDSPDFNLMKYNVADRKLLEVIIECREYNKIADKVSDGTDMTEDDREIAESVMEYLEGYSDDFDESDEDGSGEETTRTMVKVTPKIMFERFKEVLMNTRLRDQELQNICGKSLNYKLEDTKEPTLIELNDYYAIIGVNIEDESTWTPEYHFLYNFRMWKKCNKMITSYITGAKVGRGAVSVGDRESYIEGATLTKRTRPYYSDKPFDPKKEVHIMQPTFKVCAAETGRWKTGMHTIPAGSAIKNIYTSRFKNGIMAMPDYSAMEVRVIAGASGCEPMLKVFREGGDIHTNNAALIWNKPVEEITKEERRYSKMGCLRGDTKIRLINGYSMKIEDMFKEKDKEYYVYSYDRIRRKVVPGKVVDVQLTKTVKSLTRVTFDNGEVIEVTDNHPVLLAKEEYVDASKLKVGDKVESLFTRILIGRNYKNRVATRRYYEQVRDTHHVTYTPRATSYGKWVQTSHRCYEEYSDELVPENHKVVHANYNVLDNTPGNISVKPIPPRNKTYSDHNRTQALSTILTVLEGGLPLTGATYELFRSKAAISYERVTESFCLDELVDQAKKLLQVETPNLTDPCDKFKKSEFECRTVVNVETIELDDEEPVYDLSVDKYHNYAIDLGDNSGVFVHNTFALLYGADYKGFGDNFLDGDRAKAKEIFDNFFRAFPEIKDWVGKRHEEMKTTGKVTTMTQRYINISADDFNGDFNKALRASQNYPIQGSGSDQAGYVLYKIHEFIRQNNFKSKVVLFIHDSLEVDIHPDEFLAIGSQVIPLMNKFPMDEFGMVTSADLAIGYSLGQEVEVKKLETDEKYNSGVLEIVGYDDCLQPLFNNFRDHYRLFEVEDIDEPEKIYVPRNNIWIPKLAVSSMFGSYRTERKVRVKLSK